MIMDESESDSEDSEEIPRTPYRRMFVLGLLLALPCFLGAMVSCFSAVALPQMNLNIDDASWFGSASGFTSPLGGILMSNLIDFAGRKPAMLVAMTCHFIGWCILFGDYSFRVNMIGRMFTGMFTGSFFYPVQTYNAECLTANDPHFRYLLTTLGHFVNGFGMFFTFLMGAFISHRYIAAIAAVLAGVFFSYIYLFIPESPTWLYLQGRIDDAKKSQERLGIYQPILHKKILIDSPTNQFSWQNVSFSSFNNELKKLKREDVYKPLVTTISLAILGVSTGGRPLLAYLLHTLDSGSVESGLSSQSYRYGILLGGVILVANVYAVFMLQWFGAKKLTLASGWGLCLGYAIMGAAFLMKDTNSNLFIFNMVGLAMVVLAYYGGVMFLPGSILTDVFPDDAKRFGGLTILTMNLYASAMVKTHPYLFLYFGGYIYFGYLLMGVVHIVFVWWVVPDELGRKLEERESSDEEELLYIKDKH